MLKLLVVGTIHDKLIFIYHKNHQRSENQGNTNSESIGRYTCVLLKVHWGPLFHLPHFNLHGLTTKATGDAYHQMATFNELIKNRPGDLMNV